MYKFDGLAVHCPDYEESKILLELLCKEGYRWASGCPLLSLNYWPTHKEQSLYYLSNGTVAMGDLDRSDEYVRAHKFTVVPVHYIVDYVLSAEQICTDLLVRGDPL